MKSEVVSALQNANWPALLVDETGVIHNANGAAAQAFGPTAASGIAHIDTFWLPANESPSAQFLATWESAANPRPLKLRSVTGSPLSFHASLCAVGENEKNNQKYLLLQLLPAPATPSHATSTLTKAAAPATASHATSTLTKAATPVAPAPKPPPVENKNISMDAGLAHKQKLDCALQLARTVSLDFNNALTSILGHTSLVLSKMEPNNPWRHSLMEVEKSAARAAEIANDLGAFSRQEKETRVQASGNLNQLLQRNVEMFQASKLDKEVSWSLQLERKLHTAKFDEAKMQQALQKLMENAIESLGQHGRVIVQTKNIELTEPTQDRNAQLAAGVYVCAEITDTGSGIEADVLPRIFEPFFTTKRASKHRGLGLAWVYGIVTNHGGGVAVSSAPGNGTSVRVYLPADKKFVKDDGGGAANLNGNETILMVDDEDLLLTMGQTILSSYGYNVLTANGGHKALEIFSRNEKPIDLLITDLVMPNMSGRELVEQVRQVSPSTRILCSSGYVRPSAEEQQHTSYIQKPFTSQELLVRVKRALASDDPPSVD